MRFTLRLLLRGIHIHFLRWSRYRGDVFLWLLTIWLNVGIQIVLVHTLFFAAQGHFFGYGERELFGFFGIVLFTTGLAQSFIIGLILHLTRAVWQGDFDFWLLQPGPIALRMIIEDMGFVWYWPHLIIGTVLILTSFPSSLWLLALGAAVTAALIEGLFVFLVCIPTIRWGRWNPYEGLWEYFENARSMPIGRSNNYMLWLASFGVLQYSLALEVITGRLPISLLLGIALLLGLLAALLLRILLRSYSSASS